MAIIIDGKAVAEKVKDELAAETKFLVSLGKRPPCLAVILAGSDPASQIYVRNKKKVCERIGFQSREYLFSDDLSEAELYAVIDQLNNDGEVDGILIQSPLPRHLNENEAAKRVSPEKDVDCFHPENVGLLTIGNPRFLPCTPNGIMRLLREYDVEVAGKSCAVVGRSNIVGKPAALMLMQKNATVTVCHSKTKNLSEITKGADIIVAALGKKNFITADMIKDGAVLIDVGINREDKKIYGDIDFDGCAEKAAYITPVPGGVGPMTIAMLMQNTLKAYKTLEYKTF